MGFLKNLFGNRPRREPWPPPGPITTWPSGLDITVEGAALTFDRSERYVDVVGESHYQGGLDRIGGGRTGSGARVTDHVALLLPEPTNQYDENAVRVYLQPSQDGDAAIIGYLSREDAVAYRPVIDRVAERGEVMLCRASLKGGWDRGISFGVMLWIGAPWTLMAELDSDFGPDPRWPPQFTAFGEGGRPYSRADCPSCGVALDPLPKSKKKCPSCGEPIWVRTGPDDVRYLLADFELRDHEARWTGHFRPGR
jgi:hypothetical protein